MLLELASTVLAVVGVVAAAVGLGRHRRALRVQALQALAQALGLGLEHLRLGAAVDAAAASPARPPRRRPLAQRALRALLTLMPGHDSALVSGSVGTARVTIGAESAGGPGSSATVTRLRAAFDPPKALGLHIAASSGLDRLAFVDRLTRVPAGQPWLDAHVSCHARDAAGLAALLQAPGVQAGLARLFALADAVVRVEDSQVVVSLAGFVADPRRWRPLLDAAADLAATLSAPPQPGGV